MPAKIETVEVTPQALKTGDSINIKIKANMITWQDIKNNFASWNAVKSSFATWNAVKNYKF